MGVHVCACVFVRACARARVCRLCVSVLVKYTDQITMYLCACASVRTRIRTHVHARARPPARKRLREPEKDM